VVNATGEDEMNFHEIRFPTSLSFGSAGGPERRTDIVTMVNGFEERNTPWEHSRRRYDAGLGLRSLDDVDTLIAFFEARRGQLYGFRWKDWSDYKSCPPSRVIGPLDQEIGHGDGQTTTFPLKKSYVSGDQSYARPILKPVAGSVRVALAANPKVDTVDFSVDLTRGRVTFTSPPAINVRITAGFEFDVPVRFDTDRIHTSMATFNAGEVPAVPVIEVRL
jgi:uncharacterized protein (TIGR02217 family)